MATTTNPTKFATVGSISAAPPRTSGPVRGQVAQGRQWDHGEVHSAFGSHLGLESVQVAHTMNRDRRSSTHKTVDS